MMRETACCATVSQSVEKRQRFIFVDRVFKCLWDKKRNEEREIERYYSILLTKQLSRFVILTWISIKEIWGSSASTPYACVAANTWGQSESLSANVFSIAATNDNPLISDVPLSSSSVITIESEVDACRATLIWNSNLRLDSFLSCFERVKIYFPTCRRFCRNELAFSPILSVFDIWVEIRDIVPIVADLAGT